MKINGTITHVPLSGGFWGILADNGRRFRPVNGLAEEFQKEGLQVTASVTPVEAFSIFMWGTDVNVQTIQSIHQE